MALARVNFVQGTNYVTYQSNATINSVTAGNSLVILVRWDGAVSINTILCTGETIVAVGTEKSNYTHLTNGKSRWYVINNVQSSANKTVNVELTGAPAFQNCVAMWEISGAETAGIYDAELSALGTSSAPSGTLTTTAAPATIFAYASGNSSKPTAGTGYTAEGGTNIHFYDNLEYDSDMSVGAVGGKTVAFAVSQGAWGLHAISVKESGATGGSTTKPAYYYAQQ